jgi:hypothetical protein
MDYTCQITKAEENYQNLLEDFLKDIFRKLSIHSHGPDHHMRVWHYARKLLGYPEINITLTDVSLPLKLILACYLHDSGMAVDYSPGHGSQSRIFCEMFLTKNNLSPNDYSDVMDAIENHDKKDYLSNRKNSPLEIILSVADDMDAFGYTGIYRYLEIYLLRNIPISALGGLIRENVTDRFNNLVNVFGFVPALIKEQKIRYETVINFCNEMIRQGPGYQSHTNTGCYRGSYGVAEIMEGITKHELTFNDLDPRTNKINADPYIWSFFKELNHELQQV